MFTLSDQKWGEFKLIDFFDIKLSSDDLQEKNLKTGPFPLISSGNLNNGVVKLIEKQSSNCFPENIISVDMFGKAFTHSYKSYAVSHGRVNLLIPKFKMNRLLLLFFCNVIEQSTNLIFSYNRMCSSSRLQNIKILLPVTTNNTPDFEFMEAYIKQEEDKILKDYKKYVSNIEIKDIPKLEEKEWKSFILSKIFDKIQRGKRLIKSNQKPGIKPFISSSKTSNGVDNFISNSKGVRSFKDCISVANSGSVGTAFYEPYEFVASDHVTSLKKENLNKYHYLFITQILKSDFSDKYSFNHEISDKRMKREQIYLPVDNKGNPDYEYMEQYMKNIMGKQYQDYLEYLENRE